MSFISKLKTKRRLKRAALALLCVAAVAALLAPEDTHALFGLVKIADSFLGTILANLANLALTLASWLVWLGGMLFNFAVDYTLNMNQLLANIPVVNIGWTILRDISNIVFIFIALWSGISITLGIKAEKAWGLLAQMVLVALFINFSLFITKAVVDGSNVAALHFYNLMKDPTARDSADAGISGAFMNGLKLQTLYNSAEVGKGGKTNAGAAILNASPDTAKEVSEWNIILVGVFGSFFLVVVAWVFFAAAIMFIIRALVLIMLMMLSPLAFVAWLLPGAASLASKWWHMLWSQAFFAPLYMALAYVVVATINSPEFGKNLGNLTFAAAFTSTSSEHVALIFNFILLIGLMVGCLIVAQQLGARGAEMGMAGWQKIKGESISFMGRTAMRGFGLGAVGEHLRGKLEEGKVPKPLRLLTRIGATALKYTSVRNLDERLGQTKWGNLGVVKFLREQTLGRARHAKFGGAKSAEEAYEESERDASVRRKIGYLSEARRAGANLQQLRGSQGALYAQRFLAQRAMAQAQQRVSETMTPPVSAQQRATESALEQARQHLAQDPTNALNRVAVTAAELALARAQQAPPQWTPEQQRTQTALGAVAQAQQNLAANPNDPALMAARDAAQRQLEQVSPAHRELAEAEAQYQNVDDSVNEFDSSHGQEIAENTRRMSQFLAKLSPKEFLEYMPKPEFFNPALMSMEVLPTSFIDALMKDEHALTEPEKDAAYEARQHDIIEIAKRGEERWAWYHDAVQRFQRATNARNAATVRIENQVTLPSGVTLRAELTNIESLREQLARERALPQNQRNTQLVQTLEQDIQARKLAVQPLEQQRDRSIEQMVQRGELERPVEPKQPGWEEAPELRKALRNMRGLTEIGHWYQHARESLNLKHLAQTIMQGVWSDVRKSELFDSDFKENNGRALKRAYIRFSGDLTAGFNPNTTDKIAAREGFAMNELRKLANKRLTELGPEEYFARFGQAWTDADGDHESIQEQYMDLFARNAAAFDPRERTRIEHEERAMSNEERMDVRFNAGMTMYNQVAPNLASDEFTLMQGQDRDLYPVMRNLEVSQLRHYASRDLDVKIPMVEFLLRQFRDEVLGIRNMSRENVQDFTWFVNQGGQDFIPWERIRPELQEYWEQVKSIIGRTDARTLPARYPRLRENPTNDAPVIIRMNEIRAAERVRMGLPPAPPLTPRTQPFGRIGAVA